MDKTELWELAQALAWMVAVGWLLNAVGWDACGTVVMKEVLECYE